MVAPTLAFAPHPLTLSHNTMLLSCTARSIRDTPTHHMPKHQTPCRFLAISMDTYLVLLQTHTMFQASVNFFLFLRIENTVHTRYLTQRVPACSGTIALGYSCMRSGDDWWIHEAVCSDMEGCAWEPHGVAVTCPCSRRETWINPKLRKVPTCTSRYLQV